LAVWGRGISTTPSSKYDTQLHRTCRRGSYRSTDTAAAAAAAAALPKLQQSGRTLPLKPAGPATATGTALLEAPLPKYAATPAVAAPVRWARSPACIATSARTTRGGASVWLDCSRSGVCEWFYVGRIRLVQASNSWHEARSLQYIGDSFMQLLLRVSLKYPQCATALRSNAFKTSGGTQT